jgi:hypothetical protein
MTEGVDKILLNLDNKYRSSNASIIMNTIPMSPVDLKLFTNHKSFGNELSTEHQIEVITNVNNMTHKPEDFPTIEAVLQPLSDLKKVFELLPVEGQKLVKEVRSKATGDKVELVPKFKEMNELIALKNNLKNYKMRLNLVGKTININLKNKGGNRRKPKIKLKKKKEKSPEELEKIENEKREKQEAKDKKDEELRAKIQAQIEKIEASIESKQAIVKTKLLEFKEKTLPKLFDDFENALQQESDKLQEKLNTFSFESLLAPNTVNFLKKLDTMKELPIFNSRILEHFIINIMTNISFMSNNFIATELQKYMTSEMLNSKIFKETLDAFISSYIQNIKQVATDYSQQLQKLTDPSPTQKSLIEDMKSISAAMLKLSDKQLNLQIKAVSSKVEDGLLDYFKQAIQVYYEESQKSITLNIPNKPKNSVQQRFFALVGGWVNGPTGFMALRRYLPAFFFKVSYNSGHPVKNMFSANEHWKLAHTVKDYFFTPSRDYLESGDFSKENFQGVQQVLVSSSTFKVNYPDDNYYNRYVSTAWSTIRFWHGIYYDEWENIFYTKEFTDGANSSWDKKQNVGVQDKSAKSKADSDPSVMNWIDQSSEDFFIPKTSPKKTLLMI